MPSWFHDWVKDNCNHDGQTTLCIVCHQVVEIVQECIVQACDTRVIRRSGKEASTQPLKRARDCRSAAAKTAQFWNDVGFYWRLANNLREQLHTVSSTFLRLLA